MKNDLRRVAVWRCWSHLPLFPEDLSPPHRTRSALGSWGEPLDTPGVFDNDISLISDVKYKQ